MASFSMWTVFGLGFVAGAPVWGPGGFAVARAQVVAQRAAKAWREIRGVAKAIGIAVVGLTVIGLVGATHYHMFGFGG